MRIACPPRRGRTPYPATTSAARPRTQTPARTTGETGASHKQIADHQRDRAHLTTRNNAMAESWFSTIKVELLYRRIWRTKQKAELAIFRWIEGWYNPRRIQDNLGWRTPWNTKPPTRPDTTCRSPPPPRMHRSSTPSSTRRLTAPAGRSRLEKAAPTRRMDHEKGIDDPGNQLIPASNKPGEGQGGRGGSDES
jgi:Integrase core domain